jgi:hypothetical protein
VIEAPKISLRASASGVEYSDGIVSRTTGVHLRHAAAHPHKGAASISAQLPGMPQGELKTLERFAFAAASGKARESVRYGIKNARGETKAGGATDGSGATEIVTDRLTDQLRVSVGVEPADEAVAAEAVAAAENATEEPEDKWIEFTLGDTGNCAGLECVVHFDDGSQREGVFDENNQVGFQGVSGSLVDRVELKIENPDAAGSATESLLRKLGD